ncbi:molybdopterin converting factor subunit 1 [Endozoicomonas sp. 8E]|uniref:molybdopterin converting factor subunit 1 n=1 Tax=Endozoicomonas sp. 8E TaxID=3035692 RepID=UPI00293905EF|nr:molybdopterin converting factor subunit 1 [Endozoicomonas sp. 8E]WOG26823.1 molybdopterin converting factor subunit 1 [Endozoicomonas sp. 8E]
MIKVLFFASYREKLGTDRLELAEIPENLSALRSLLSERGQDWQEVVNDSRTLVALNQTMTRKDFAIKEGDEIAFFPPVTGG